MAFKVTALCFNESFSSRFLADDFNFLIHRWRWFLFFIIRISAPFLRRKFVQFINQGLPAATISPIKRRQANLFIGTRKTSIRWNFRWCTKKCLTCLLKLRLVFILLKEKHKNKIDHPHFDAVLPWYIYYTILYLLLRHSERYDLPWHRDRCSTALVLHGLEKSTFEEVTQPM